MAGPLAGFKIIDVCRAGPGRTVSGLLADYGADVISVVQPGYAETRQAAGATKPGFGQTNHRNKRSIFLNLKISKDHETLVELLRGADAVLESNRPGVARRLGIDYERVRTVNPSILYVALSGFGQYGPYATIAAHDLSYQGVAGSVPVNANGIPFVPHMNSADEYAAHYGAMAVLMGLLERTNSGLGQYVDIAFCDVVVRFPPGGLEDEMLRGTYPCYNIYETADDRYLSLSTREPIFWERLCTLLGHTEWMSEIRPQGKLREEMQRSLSEAIKTRTLAEWLVLMRDADLEFGPVNITSEQLAADPHLNARDMVRRTVDPVSGGAVLEPGLPLKFSRTVPEIWRERSVMGEDGAAVLQQIRRTDG